MERIQKRHELAGTSDYNDTESLCIQLENMEESIGFNYAPILEQIAIAHLMSAACLEAHINRRAKDHLEGKMFDEFDQHSSAMAKQLVLKSPDAFDGSRSRSRGSCGVSNAGRTTCCRWR